MIEIDKIRYVVANEIEKSWGKKILIIGPPGCGKTIAAHMIALEGKRHVLVGCKSNGQAFHHFTETRSRCENEGVDCYANGLYGNNYYIKKHFGVKAVFNDSKNHWEPSSTNKRRTIAEITSTTSFEDMNKMQKLVFDSLFVKSQDYDNQLEYHYKLHFMTHFRLKSIAIEQECKDDMVVFYDDIDSRELNPLYSTAEYPHFQDYEEEIEIVGVNKRPYYVRPDKYDPFKMWKKEGTTVVATTTSKHIELMFRAQYPEGIVINIYDMDIDDSKLKSSIKFISTDVTKSRVDGYLPMLSESVKEEWPHEFIGDGMGLNLNYATVNGLNDKSKVNLLTECSYPAAGVIEELYDVLCYCSSAGESQYSEEELAVMLMRDALDQALGRNQKYRSNGYEAIVLVDKRYRAEALEGCQFKSESDADLITNLSKLKTKHPMLFALKNLNKFVGNGEYKEWVDIALENASDAGKMEARLKKAEKHWEDKENKKFKRWLKKKLEKWDSCRKLFLDEKYNVIRNKVRDKLNLGRHFTNDEVIQMFNELETTTDFGNNPPKWVSDVSQIRVYRLLMGY